MIKYEIRTHDALQAIDVSVRGRVSTPALLKLNEEIKAACEAHQHDLIICERAHEPTSTNFAFEQYYILTAIGLGENKKLAWVVSDSNERKHYHLLASLVNRQPLFTAEVFADKEAAERWLQNEP